MTYRDRLWPEGGPCGHMDFHTSPDQYEQALTMLESALGERPGSVKAGVEELIKRLHEMDSSLTRTIDERDSFHEWADDLAQQAIAPEDVLGEHSSANNPWRNALAHQDQVLAMLHSALGERPGSVVDGVRALLDAVAEAKPFPVRCGADHMSDSARQAQADLAEARRKGAEQERARIAGKILRHCGNARESALAYPTGDPRIAISDIYCTGLEKLAREIESGEWSGKEVDDG